MVFIRDKWNRPESLEIELHKYSQMIFNKGVTTIKWSKESLQQIVLDVDMLGGFSSVQFFVTLWTVARQAPLSMGFSRPEHWSGLTFPSPGDLPNPGIEPGSLALQVDSLPAELPGKDTQNYWTRRHMCCTEHMVLSEIPTSIPSQMVSSKACSLPYVSCPECI